MGSAVGRDGRGHHGAHRGPECARPRAPRGWPGHRRPGDAVRPGDHGGLDRLQPGAFPAQRERPARHRGIACEQGPGAVEPDPRVGARRRCCAPFQATLRVAGGRVFAPLPERCCRSGGGLEGPASGRHRGGDGAGEDGSGTPGGRGHCRPMRRRGSGVRPAHHGHGGLHVLQSEVLGGNSRNGFECPALPVPGPFPVVAGAAEREAHPADTGGGSQRRPERRRPRVVHGQEGDARGVHGQHHRPGADGGTEHPVRDHAAPGSGGQGGDSGRGPLLRRVHVQLHGTDADVARRTRSVRRPALRDTGFRIAVPAGERLSHRTRGQSATPSRRHCRARGTTGPGQTGGPGGDRRIPGYAGYRGDDVGPRLSEDLRHRGDWHALHPHQRAVDAPSRADEPGAGRSRESRPPRGIPRRGRRGGRAGVQYRLTCPRGLRALCGALRRGRGGTTSLPVHGGGQVRAGAAAGHRTGPCGAPWRWQARPAGSGGNAGARTVPGHRPRPPRHRPGPGGQLGAAGRSAAPS